MSARALTVLLAALVLGLVVVGCGGDEEGKPLPSAQVQLLNGRLDETQRRLDDGSSGACRDILDDTRPEVQKVIDSMPSDVDADVRDALVESFDNLWSLVEDRCQEAEQDEQSQEPEPEPTETETTETQTEPPETTTEEPTPPATEELPPEDDGDNGGGVPGRGDNGSGVGSGGGVGPGGNLGGGE